MVSHKKGRCLPVDETCHRAFDALDSSRDYHLIFNNCEHFASYCKTGRARSGQVRRAAALAGGVMGLVAVAAVGRWRRKGEG